MNKQQLLHELAHDTHATLKPSALHGIGVFAIRDIPAGTSTIFSKEKGDWITVSRQEVDALPQHAKELVENHCLYDDNHYFLPGYGFKRTTAKNGLMKTGNVMQQQKTITWILLGKCWAG